jgi:hypothetical protein
MGFKGEKLPPKYEQGKVQRAFDLITQGFSKKADNQDKSVNALDAKINARVDTEVKKLNQKIEDKGKRLSLPDYLPLPQDLLVHDLVVFGFTTVNPVVRWKYFGRINGYEFYGSHNTFSTSFTAESLPYTQTGIHYQQPFASAVDSPTLYTKDTETAENTFYLEGNLVKLGPALNDPYLVLENVTKGTEGNITVFSGAGLNIADAPFILSVSDVTWDVGDIWRISKYPGNRLFSLDSLAFFLKYPGVTFNVIARTVGSGNSFSAFVSSDSSAVGDPSDVRNLLPVTAGPINPEWDPPSSVYNYWGEWRQDIMVTWDDFAPEEGIIEVDVQLWDEKTNKSLGD